MKPPEEKVGPPASGGTQKYDQLFVDGSTNQLGSVQAKNNLNLNVSHNVGEINAYKTLI